MEFNINGHYITIRKGEINGRTGWIVADDGVDKWIFATSAAAYTHINSWFR